jgi:hypothetical protein
MKKEFVMLVEESNKVKIMFENFKCEMDFHKLINEVSQLNEFSFQGIMHKLHDFFATTDELEGRDRVIGFAMEVFTTTPNQEVKLQAKKVIELSRQRSFEQAAAEMVNLIKLIAQPKPIRLEPLKSNG